MHPIVYYEIAPHPRVINADQYIFDLLSNKFPQQIISKIQNSEYIKNSLIQYHFLAAIALFLRNRIIAKSLFFMEFVTLSLR